MNILIILVITGLLTIVIIALRSDIRDAEIIYAEIVSSCVKRDLDKIIETKLVKVQRVFPRIEIYTYGLKLGTIIDVEMSDFHHMIEQIEIAWQPHGQQTIYFMGHAKSKNGDAVLRHVLRKSSLGELIDNHPIRS